MNDWQWLLWLIPIAAVLSWGVQGAIRAAKGGGPAKTDLDPVRQRLDAIDTRLAAVEKTLNDIP